MFIYQNRFINKCARKNLAIIQKGRTDARNVRADKVFFVDVEELTFLILP